jgi:hypothetical protein
VFGSAIHVPGLSYKDYMLPGIIGRSLAFGVIGAGVATQWVRISALVASVRGLTEGYHSGGSWQLAHPELAMVLWCFSQPACRSRCVASTARSRPDDRCRCAIA